MNEKNIKEIIISIKNSCDEWLSFTSLSENNNSPDPILDSLQHSLDELKKLQDEFHQSTRKEFIEKHKKSQKMTSAEYNNKEVDAFVTDKSGFVDPEKIAAIDLYGFEKAKKMWENGEPDWETRMMLQDKSISDYLNWKTPNIYKKQIDDTVYGFVHK